MFKINYGGKYYEIDSYIEVGSLKFLLYLKECDIIISSDKITREEFKKFLQIKYFLDEKVKNNDEKLSEYKYLNYHELSFYELLKIYRNINGSSKNCNLIRYIIKENMEKRIYQYENEGRDIGIYGLKALIRNSMGTYPEKNDGEIYKLVEEYSILLKIKAYEKMDLYELLSEKDRILDIIRNNDDKLNTGFPNVSMEVLEKRIFPAIKTLIKIKEDIYMLELFNLYRDILRQNPYTVDIRNYKENKNIGFFYVEDVQAIFEYGFYEKLGINLDFFEEEIKNFCPCHYEYISEYLYSIGYFAISRIKYTNDFSKKIYLLKKKYGHIKFIKYFLEYLEKIIRIT